MRVFLDANILFSAAKTNGAMRELLRLLQAADHECWIDDFVYFEAHRNLAKKGPAALSALDAVVASCRLGPAQARATSTSPSQLDWLPEKDRPILAAVIRLRCDVLLTGDRTHIGTGYGKVFAGVMIYSPRSLAETLFH